MNDLVDMSAQWVPSREAEMLLRVAFAPEGQARDAGLAWLATMNLATQSEAANRLLPLVHDRLLREGIDHPAMAILKGVRRKVWCRNQLLFRHATPTIQALRHAGIDVMLLKGAALTLHYYHDYSLRPMGDFDLMVPFKDVTSAIEILHENGWKSESPMQGKLGRNIFTYIHAEHFTDNSGLDMDFHWHLSPLCVDTVADSSFWNSSIAVRFDAVDVRVLNPASQLLHVCVHGLIWSGIPGIRWIPDSLAIIREAPDLDWNMLLLQAQERNLALFVKTALNYLVDRFGAPVPREVLRAMNDLPVTPHETKEFTVHSQSPYSNPMALQKQCSIPKTLQVMIFTYRRIALGAKLSGYNVTISGYLSALYRRTNGWRLFFYILYRIGRRASRSMRGVITEGGGRAGAY